MDTLLAEVLSSIVHSPRRSHTSSIRTCRAGSTDQYHLYGQPLLLLFYYVRRESPPTISLRDFAPLRIRSDMVQCETYNQSRPDRAKLLSRLLASSAVQSTPLLATFILAKLRTHGSRHISDTDLPSVFDPQRFTTASHTCIPREETPSCHSAYLPERHAVDIRIALGTIHIFLLSSSICNHPHVQSG